MCTFEVCFMWGSFFAHVLYFEQSLIKSSGGSKGALGTLAPHSWPKTLHFHAVLRQKWPNYRVEALKGWRPSLGNPGSATAKVDHRVPSESEFQWDIANWLSNVLLLRGLNSVVKCVQFFVWQSLPGKFWTLTTEERWWTLMSTALKINLTSLSR